MAKNAFPKIHVKTLVFSFLVLLVPLFIVIASSASRQNTQSSAFHESGGPGVLPAPENATAVQVKCLNPYKAIVDFSWRKVPNAYGYVINWVDDSIALNSGTAGVGTLRNGRIHIQDTVLATPNSIKTYRWWVDAGILGKVNGNSGWEEIGKPTADLYFAVNCK